MDGVDSDSDSFWSAYDYTYQAQMRIDDNNGDFQLQTVGGNGPNHRNIQQARLGQSSGTLAFLKHDEHALIL